MTETEKFTPDLPPTFRFSPGTQEEKERQVEEWLERMREAVDENLKRLFNRVYNLI